MEVRFMQNDKIFRPYALSIAGFDPCGGAGVLADIKTFEANQVLGMGVITGITFQNDAEFDNVKWLDINDLTRQIAILTKKFHFPFIKAGLVENLDTLETIISYCRQPATGSRLIWDPILKTSSGFHIHNHFEKEKLISILKKIYLLTPNTEEIKILTGENDEMLAAKKLSEHCNVFLKGGHCNTDFQSKRFAKDYLFTTDGKIYPYRAKKISLFPKHGSGCVLSAAITANLLKGETLHRACLKAKNYITGFLWSNKTLLGYHKS